MFLRAFLTICPRAATLPPPEGRAKSAAPMRERETIRGDEESPCQEGSGQEDRRGARAEGGREACRQAGGQGLCRQGWGCEARCIQDRWIQVRRLQASSIEAFAVEGCAHDSRRESSCHEKSRIKVEWKGDLRRRQGARRQRREGVRERGQGRDERRKARDEWHQAFVPSRSASAIDVAIDTCGAICGAFWTWHGERNSAARGNAQQLVKKT